MSTIVTTNFLLGEDVQVSSSPEIIKETIKDNRNNISVVNLIPNTQGYLNYLKLLMSLRDKWVSVGYLDLGMIPIIMGPSFWHDVLVSTWLPNIKSAGLIVYPMPGVSLLCSNNMRGVTDYWAFRDDVAKFLDCDPSKVTTEMVFRKLMGVD